MHACLHARRLPGVQRRGLSGNLTLCAAGEEEAALTNDDPVPCVGERALRAVWRLEDEARHMGLWQRIYPDGGVQPASQPPSQPASRSAPGFVQPAVAHGNSANIQGKLLPSGRSKLMHLAMTMACTCHVRPGGGERARPFLAAQR
jgi:hypothetical protein